MGWGKPVKLGIETLNALKKVMEEVKAESPNQAVMQLLELYEAMKGNLKGNLIKCPYCEKTTFQSTIQLRKHIVNVHILDIVEDIKKYGRG